MSHQIFNIQFRIYRRIHIQPPSILLIKLISRCLVPFCFYHLLIEFLKFPILPCWFMWLCGSWEFFYTLFLTVKNWFLGTRILNIRKIDFWQRRFFRPFRHWRLTLSKPFTHSIQINKFEFIWCPLVSIIYISSLKCRI